MKYFEQPDEKIIPEYGWDFSEDKKSIIITHKGNEIMKFSMYEVIDCSDPEFMMGHIYNDILPCKWKVGKWKDYFSEKLQKKLES